MDDDLPAEHRSYHEAIEEPQRGYEAQGHCEHQARYPNDDRIEHVRSRKYAAQGSQEQQTRYPKGKRVADSSFHEVGTYMVDTNLRNIYGKGSFGTVHPGFHKHTKQNIAAKNVSCLDEKEYEDDIDKEVDILEMIPPHENIISISYVTKERVLKFGQQCIDIWIVTEVCDLGNLKDYTMGRYVSFYQKIHMMMQCALALQHLHLHKPCGITHRDLKPLNILVTGDPEKPTIKLCDFGLARLVDMNQFGRSVTLHSSRVGTYDYMAPELFSMIVDQAMPSYNKSVDVFSLGLCFLVLLNLCYDSGIKPFTGKTQPFLRSAFTFRRWVMRIL